MIYTLSGVVFSKVRSLRYTDDIHHEAPASAPITTRSSQQQFSPSSSQRDREMRDVYFEKR